MRDDLDLENRELCSDGGCIGVIEMLMFSIIRISLASFTPTTYTVFVWAAETNSLPVHGC